MNKLTFLVCSILIISSFYLKPIESKGVRKLLHRQTTLSSRDKKSHTALETQTRESCVAKILAVLGHFGDILTMNLWYGTGIPMAGHDGDNVDNDATTIEAAISKMKKLEELADNQKTMLGILGSRCELTGNAFYDILTDGVRTTRVGSLDAMGELLASNTNNIVIYAKVELDQGSVSHIWLIHKVNKDEIYLLSSWVAHYDLVQWLKSAKGTKVWTSVTLTAELTKLKAKATQKAALTALFGVTDVPADAILEDGEDLSGFYSKALACGAVEEKLTAWFAAAASHDLAVVNSENKRFKEPYYATMDLISKDAGSEADYEAKNDKPKNLS